uniref:Tc1-like transposase DDE domain-containing protein n=1 Tax=Sander lucioperca TaxID=283035 RepID=A0A8D0A0Z2_SANLU
MYCEILGNNLLPSVRLKRNWTLQHDNDPKHTSKSTKDWLKTKKWRVLEWPSQSPDLNPIEMLWGDLKWAVRARNPSNITHVKAFCIEEWEGYKKRLTEVISAKGGNTRY